jgi:hypothetical protein
MIYPLVAITAAMSGYMAWLLVFRLRRDRVLAQRDLTRGKFAFRPKDRLRYLLKRSFDVPPERPDWEDRLVSGLSGVEKKAASSKDEVL